MKHLCSICETKFAEMEGAESCEQNHGNRQAVQYRTAQYLRDVQAYVSEIRFPETEQDARISE